MKFLISLLIGGIIRASCSSAINLHAALRSRFDSDLISKVADVKLGDIPMVKNDAWKIWGEMEETIPRQKIESEITHFNNFVSSKVNANTDKGCSNYNTETWEVITNEASFQAYQLRVKRTHPESLGVDTVNQYSGYFDIEADDKHFFYWFFESRNDPANDPVLLWLNGGPGCSSMTGLFFELGPSCITNETQPKLNPYSWNSNASVIFMEQPIGVGYSYSHTSRVSSSRAAAKDVYVFLELFFQKFQSFSANDFHIGGESYGGHYLPAIGSEIIKHNDRTFPLTSIMIGNGLTDALVQYKYYRGMACGEGGYRQVISDEECQQMEHDYSKCAELIQKCYDSQDAFTCIPASVYCESKMLDPYSKTGLNFYDMRKECGDSDLCYDEMDYISEYMNKPEVMEALGAEVDSFASCDDEVFHEFYLTGDEPKPFQGLVAELLEAQVPVLIYAGDKDYVCNWLGNYAWSDALDWSGREKFEAQQLRSWHTLGEAKHAGEVKSHGNFTFLRVFDAGHMVPYDQPANSLDMINRWLRGDYTFGL